MLSFDAEFRVSGYRNSCTVWASEPKLTRVRFSINNNILTDVLKGGNPAHDFANLALCERERPRIEAACRLAFTNRASADIQLQPRDFG